MANEPTIITQLKKNNTQDCKIKIRAKAKSGGYSIFLDYFNNGIREFEYLDKSLHLTGTPKTLSEDKKKLALIVAIRAERQNEYLKNKTGFSLMAEKDIDFIAYFKKLAEKKQDTVWAACYKMFIDFVKVDRLDLKKIDYKLCLQFSEFLTAKTGKDTNTALVYLSKLKAVFNLMIKEELISKSPAKSVNIETKDTKREFLSIEEIQLLSATPKPNIETCNAFLFSCFTGLRISDLRALTFEQITNDGYIEFRQQKTSGVERMKLNDTALSIIKIQSEFKRSNKVFKLNVSPSIENHLKKWIKAAGINKYITFHCSRHTFATLAITNNIDLYSISKLLGHRNIKTTQIYATMIDKKKDEAIDKMPNIKL